MNTPVARIRKPKAAEVGASIPQHAEAEQQILGHAMLSGDWSIIDALDESDFYDHRHRAIFAAAKWLRSNDHEIDPVSIMGRCPNERLYITELGDHLYSANTTYWIRLIVEASQMRKLWLLANDLFARIGKNAGIEECLQIVGDSMDHVKKRLREVYQEDAGAAWRDQLQWEYDKQGKRRLATTKSNFALIFAHDPRLIGTMVFDEFRCDVVFRREPPWNEDESGLGSSKIGQWEDADYTRLQCWVEREYGAAPDKNTCIDLIVMIAARNKTHPIREYLENLRWDGRSRLDTWLRDYCGATGSPDYHSLIGAKWLISAVARIFQPGCKADHVLILEGLQGAGKSTALKTLATVDNVAWFADTPVILGSKDAFIQLQGVWILELAELDSILRAEDSTAKAFFTSTADRYRPPYTRTAKDFPRQCIMAGTVNGDDYLRDETGGRRYWPVWCERFDIERLEQDRNQIWAEAVARYKKGERWFPHTSAERDLCEAEQRLRRQEDAWLPVVADWLRDNVSDAHTAAEILYGAVGIPIERISRREQHRLAKIMAQIPGWEQRRTWRGGRTGQQVRVFAKIGCSDNP